MLSGTLSGVIINLIYFCLQTRWSTYFCRWWRCWLRPRHGADRRVPPPVPASPWCPDTRKYRDHTEIGTGAGAGTETGTGTGNVQPLRTWEANNVPWVCVLLSLGRYILVLYFWWQVTCGQNASIRITIPADSQFLNLKLIQNDHELVTEWTSVDAVFYL